MEDTPEARRRTTALEEGRAALRTHRPVIWIHGLPYADPANDPEPATADPWPEDDGQPDEGQP